MDSFGITEEDLDGFIAARSDDEGYELAGQRT